VGFLPTASAQGRPCEERGQLTLSDQTQRGLTGDDFRPIAINGFSEGVHSYAHSMAWFGGRLYVGTTVHALALINATPQKIKPQLDPWPVLVPKDLFSLDLRASIFRYDPREAKWERAFVSPMIDGRNGLPVARDVSYRGMAVCQGENDERPALYVSAGCSTTRGYGACLLRTEDGLNYTLVGEPGLGDPDVSSYRTLVSFRGRLYTSPAGAGKSWNIASRPSVYELNDIVRGSMREVSLPGFGNPANQAIFQLGVFKDRLYAGTANPKTGYEVWRSDAHGNPPYKWTKVLDGGAGRGPLNEGVTTMCAFKEALYVGGGIQHGGYDRNYGIGPAPAEVIRIHPDDTFDIVCGGARDTAQGFKTPTSGSGPGFDNFFVGYIWYMASHAGHLYIGTLDSSTFLVWANGEQARQWAHWVDRDRVVRTEGGFDLWTTSDGVGWRPVTRTGFDNHFNYGARTLVSSPHGLFVGTANPFAPQVAVRKPDGSWTYEPNPRGGCEIWQGGQALRAEASR